LYKPTNSVSENIKLETIINTSLQTCPKIKDAKIGFRGFHFESNTSNSKKNQKRKTSALCHDSLATF
jgi:hypothetical protein